jgi:branched-chain amino acid transport system ATP-binding protein
MLTLNEIGKTFGGVRAVHNVSLTLESGNIYGLIGPNGAGKSTLVNLISGVLSSSEGTIALAGHSIDRMSAHQRARHGIARTFQNLRVFPSLTVAQNIDVAGYSRPRKDKARSNQLAQDAINAFDLRDKLSQPAGSLSYGHLRRLEIVRALALNPKILMLDEPAAGMNELETQELGVAIDWVRTQSDCAMLVIDHDLRFIMSLCKHIFVLNMGTLIAEGTPEEITHNQTVIDAYLGDELAA